MRIHVWIRYVHHGGLTPPRSWCTVPGWRTKRGTLRKNGGHRRVSNPGLADWGMEPPTASRIVRLLPRLWNPGLADWGMEPPTADRGVRLLPRLWNPSVTDRTMDRGAVQDLFTADRCGLLSRAACTVNPGAVQKGQDASNCELPMAQRIEAAPVPFGKAIPHRTRNLEGVNQPCSDLA
jgi:phage tail protein X